MNPYHNYRSRMIVRIVIATLVVDLALAFFAWRAMAEPTTQARPAYIEHRYEKLYWQVARTHGRRVPGRNLLTRGIRTHGRVRPASSRELARSIRTFQRWLAPPRGAVRSSDYLPHGQSPAYQGGKWAIPASIVMCESHGNYNAVNPSSGAYGAYQILPSTSASLGCDMATPAGQDECARRVWATQGRGAWVC